MARIFAIGDIHGCCNTFEKLLFEELKVLTSDKIYCIGDYIDRGNNSKGVIDLIINLRIKGYQVYTIRGNHEQMMLDSVIDLESLHLWLQNGGMETLKSFDISSVKELPGRYLEFLEQTELFIETGNYIFVHAGLNFRMENPFADEGAMLWTRDDYFDKEKINNRILIHGHTPIPLKRILKQLSSNKINIDGGCVYNYKPAFGNLIALSLTEMKLIAMKNID